VQDLLERRAVVALSLEKDESVEPGVIPDSHRPPENYIFSCVREDGNAVRQNAPIIGLDQLLSKKAAGQLSLLTKKKILLRDSREKFLF
jgi:hypothetical protein